MSCKQNHACKGGGVRKGLTRAFIEHHVKYSGGARRYIRRLLRRG